MYFVHEHQIYSHMRNFVIINDSLKFGHQVTSSRNADHPITDFQNADKYRHRRQCQQRTWKGIFRKERWGLKHPRLGPEHRMLGLQLFNPTDYAKASFGHHGPDHWLSPKSDKIQEQLLEMTQLTYVPNVGYWNSNDASIYNDAWVIPHVKLAKTRPKPKPNRGIFNFWGFDGDPRTDHFAPFELYSFHNDEKAQCSVVVVPRPIANIDTLDWASKNFDDWKWLIDGAWSDKERSTNLQFESASWKLDLFGAWPTPGVIPTGQQLFEDSVKEAFEKEN